MAQLWFFFLLSPHCKSLKKWWNISILMGVTTYGKYQSNIRDSLLYHHHQTDNYENICWMNGIHLPVQLQRLRIYSKVHWSNSGSSWWLNTLKGHYVGFVIDLIWCIYSRFTDEPKYYDHLQMMQLPFHNSGASYIVDGKQLVLVMYWMQAYQHMRAMKTILTEGLLWQKPQKF